MRLVTFYTPSHENMMNEFVMPYAADFDDTVVGVAAQKCPAAAFKQEGWNECMDDKIETLLSVPCDDQPTLYVDSDVALSPRTARWARSVEIREGEVIFSDDVVQMCAGVMLFRPSERIVEWWRLVRQMSMIWNLPDQDVIHQMTIHAGERSGRLPILTSVMDGAVVCNWATVQSGAQLSPWNGEPFDVPSTCVAWHANWTIGVERKTQMLRMAKGKMKR